VTAEDRDVLNAAAGLLKHSPLPIITNACIPLMQILADKQDTLTTLLENTAALLVNESEWTTLLQLPQIADGALQRLPLLQEVVVTEGELGGRFAQRPFHEWNRYAGERVTALCTLGAGDTFNGAYIAERWIRAAPLDDACERAAATAARKVACGVLHLLDDLHRRSEP
jgi:sugar/nucleoside kinase (ribokinase family)